MNINQKRRWAFGSALLLALLVALYFLWPQPAPRAFTIALTGTPGTELRGYWVADGVANPFRGTLPTNFTHVARSVSFELVQESRRGIFRFALTPEGSQLGPLSGETDYGLRGHIFFNGKDEDRSMYSFSRQ